jgi:hypothetical protein
LNSTVFARSSSSDSACICGSSTFIWSTRSWYFLRVVALGSFLKNLPKNASVRTARLLALAGAWRARGRAASEGSCAAPVKEEAAEEEGRRATPSGRHAPGAGLARPLARPAAPTVERCCRVV